MSTALTPSALANADLIRALAKPDRADDLFEASGQTNRSNFKRSLDRMAEDGLVRFGGAANKPFLTQAGQRARKALDVADGVARTHIEVLHAALTPHPDNPREHCGAAELESLADTILAEGGVLQPLVVGRPDANGVRLIYIGERRWRATALLIARDDAEASRVGNLPIPCFERADEPGLIFELSLVENGQRVPLTQLEQAEALASLAQARNWKAPQLSKRTGIHHKLVQEALKVVAEAAPEDIAAHRADPEKHTWTALRDSVKVAKPKSLLPDLSDAERCALIELAYAIHERMGPQAGSTRVHGHQGDPLWLGLRDRNLIKPVVVGDGRMYAELGPLAGQWMREEVGFYPAPDATVTEARAKLVGALQAQSLERGEFLTAWLNLPVEALPAEPEREPDATPADDGSPTAAIPTDDEAADDAPDPGVALYADMAGKALEPAPAKARLTPPPPEPPNLDTPKLDDAQGIILVELAWAIQERGLPPSEGRGRTVVVGSFYSDATAQGAIHAKLLVVATGPRNSWVAWPTDRGWRWLQAHGYANDARDPTVSAGTLQAMQARVSPTGWTPLAEAGRLHTEWLNPPEAAPATPPPAPPPAAVETGALVLDEVRSARADTPDSLVTLFKLAGLEGPFTFGGDPQEATICDASGVGVCTIDASGDEDEPLVVARCELVARALNAALGLEGGE